MPREHDFGRGADAEQAGAERGAEAEAEAVHTQRIHRGDTFFSGASNASSASGSLGGMTKAELVKLAAERGVDDSGTKAEIIERLGGE